MYSLNCRGRLLSWENPIIMGVLNITPDSFYSGSRISSEDNLLAQAEKMLIEGASILDLGGLSSRPGAEEISIEEETDRVLPAIERIAKNFPDAFISVDSYRYQVAKMALEAGAGILNDIGAGEEENLLRLAAEMNAPYICMHIRGNPRTMQDHTEYEDIMGELIDYFLSRRTECLQLGISDMIIDPGFGFAKTIRQNFYVLKHLRMLGMLEMPVLVGLSRKATIYKTLNITPEQSLNGTTVMHTLALSQGANILRVHDVREAMEAIRLWASYTSV